MIIATTDGGRTWARQYNGSVTVINLDLVTAEDGWVLGQRTLLRTTDGGRRWMPAGEPPLPLQQVDLVTATLGWGVAGGALYATRDGGLTWAALATPTPIGGACFLDQRRGWAVNAPMGSPHPAPTAIFQTSDGGRTWQTMTLPPGTGGPSGAAGGRWQTLRCTAPETLWDLVVFDSYAGGEGYALFRSGDGGVHWQAVAQNRDLGIANVPKGPGPRPGSLDAVGATTAYLTGICGGCDGTGTTTIAGTTDAGRTWRYATIPGLPFTANAISFLDGSRGWLVATWLVAPGQRRSAVLATRDGGRSWTERAWGVARLT